MKVHLRKREPITTAYDVLGCSPALTTEEIHEGYLELAFANHPDRGGDAEVFKKIALAWGQLKSRENRDRYDAQLRLENVLNCSLCRGAGLRDAFLGGRFHKNAICSICGGRGHL